MSKTVIIGDIHGRDSWKQIIKDQNPDRVVFVGDYFDSYDNNLTAAIQLHNFQEIIAYKQSTEANVVMLIGNHDYHYYPGGEQYSGYQYGAAPLIRQILNENKHHLQMCYQLDDILFSHAGIGYNWLVEQNKYTTGNIADFVNDLWTYKPGVFRFTGIDQSGNSKTQTPIWIRPQSLLAGNRDTFLKKDYIQIAGHTQVRYIDIKGKATGGRYYFIDALEEGMYLIYEDGKFNIGNLVS